MTVGSRKLNGWEFVCDNPVCDEKEQFFTKMNVLEETAWLQGAMDVSTSSGQVEFTACSQGCLTPAILAMLESHASRKKADISEVGGY